MNAIPAAASLLSSEAIASPRAAELLDNPESIDDPVLGFFLDYHRRTRLGRKLPLRKSFVPQEVRANLQWVTVADALPGLKDFRYRVVGSRVCDYYLGDGTGKTVREAFVEAPIVGKSVLRLYRHTCTLAVPVLFSGPAIIMNSLYFPEHALLLLPYSSDGETADRVIVALSYDRLKLHDTRGAASNAHRLS